MRALIASQAFGSNRRRGPRWSARNASALDACSAWFMIALAGLNNAASQASDAEPERSSLLAKERIPGGQVRQFSLARLVLSLILGAAVCASAVSEPGAAGGALARGDAAEAEKAARRAVDIVSRNPHRRSTEPLRALGAALAAEERSAEAAEVLNEALAEDRQHHGSDGADTARSLAQLANAELRSHRFAEALPLIQQAVAIDQERLGPAHPFIADDLFDLGLVYDGLKRTVEARRAFAAALAVLERGAGRDTPRAAYVELELARIDRQDGKEAEAEAASRHAKRILYKAEDEERRRERRL